MRIRFIELLVGIVMVAGTAFGQTITTVAGYDHTGGCSHADGVPATTECIMPSGIAFDSQYNLYLVDGFKVRKVDHLSQIITTVAGTTYGYSGDNGPATNAQLSLQVGAPGLSGLAVDSQGNIYISDTHNCAIRLVTAATGIITTMAGGTCGYAGDNGPANKASLFYPSGIALDAEGNLYIADNLSNRVRKVDKSSGMISTVAGNGDPLWESDGVAANSTGLRGPVGVKFDNHGNLYIAEGNRVRKVNTSGVISTIAGSTGNFTNYGSSGDGGLATAALLFGPLDLVIDPAGDVYIADNQNLKVRKIDTSASSARTRVFSDRSLRPSVTAVRPPAPISEIR
jgi:NHL repeat-containing protein